MTKLRYLLIAVLVLVLGGIVIAQRPARDISGRRHPHLAAAQRMSRQAWQQVVDAQQANEWDMQGHAQRAKDLLDHADSRG